MWQSFWINNKIEISGARISQYDIMHAMIRPTGDEVELSAFMMPSLDYRNMPPSLQALVVHDVPVIAMLGFWVPIKDYNMLKFCDSESS